MLSRRKWGFLFLSLLATAHASAEVYHDRLYGGEAFRYGEWLSSPNRRYSVTLHNPGSLVLTKDGNVIWKSGYHAGSECAMQLDGNLVVRAKTNRNAPPAEQWRSNTSGNPSAYLQVTDDGKMIIIGQGGKTIWSAP